MRVHLPKCLTALLLNSSQMRHLFQSSHGSLPWNRESLPRVPPQDILPFPLAFEEFLLDLLTEACEAPWC